MSLHATNPDIEARLGKLRRRYGIASFVSALLWWWCC